MWPLKFFESNNILVPETDSPPTLDGIITYLIVIALFIAFNCWLNKKTGKPYKSWIIIGIINFAIVALSLVGGGFMLMNLWIYLTLFFAIGQVIQLNSRIWYSDLIPSLRKIFHGLTISIIVLLVFSIYCYFRSYVYYLPASYPPEQRDQLRMIRRIIEVEPHENELDKPITPISEVHLVLKERELIPDSIRNNAEYQGYRYILKPNYPYPKLYTLDVIPIQYKPGMPSYHVFPTNPEVVNSKDWFKYVIYCATMSDKGGLPATEKDRHFHHKGFWVMLFTK